MAQPKVRKGSPQRAKAVALSMRAQSRNRNTESQVIVPLIFGLMV